MTVKNGKMSCFLFLLLGAAPVRLFRKPPRRFSIRVAYTLIIAQMIHKIK